jgi:hypothetical protein
MCVDRIFKCTFALAAIIGVAYCGINFFVIWTELPKGLRDSGWGDIAENTAGFAAIIFLVTCAMVMVACVVGAWPFYLPFLTTASIMLVYLAASRKIFLKDLEENELNAIMFAALASFFASALIIMIICFKNAYDVSKRTIPAFSLPRRSSAGAGRSHPENGGSHEAAQDTVTQTHRMLFPNFHMHPSVAELSSESDVLAACPEPREKASTIQTLWWGTKAPPQEGTGSSPAVTGATTCAGPPTGSRESTA